MVRFTKIVYNNGLVRFKTTIRRRKSRRKKKLCTPKKRLGKSGHNHDHGAKLHVCSISCMKTMQVHIGPKFAQIPQALKIFTPCQQPSRSLTYGKYSRHLLQGFPSQMISRFDKNKLCWFNFLVAQFNLFNVVIYVLMEYTFLCILLMNQH